MIPSGAREFLSFRQTGDVDPRGMAQNCFVNPPVPSFWEKGKFLETLDLRLFPTTAGNDSRCSLSTSDCLLSSSVYLVAFDQFVKGEALNLLNIRLLLYNMSSDFFKTPSCFKMKLSRLCPYSSRTHDAGRVSESTFLYETVSLTAESFFSLTRYSWAGT